MLFRYRYRAYPTSGQAAMLARTFGCARVVFNDALRTRQDAHAAGEKISDTEVQRRVVTLAKTTPGREWLGEVASVALVQACRDARRAYRNWFDPLSGRRKGRMVGRPRFRSRKDNRQSIRLEEKAARYDRQVVKVSRWFPSSQLCSACGCNAGKKPLEVRSWTCPTCGAAHDRDLNAARNIRDQGRKVAAGLAETQNARGGSARPGPVLASADEARTRRGAA